ncbi:carbon-nitrogen hydrolase family protein [Salinisphaera sp. Q1T1-3]|uniref:carbon-nitrogen hydrolase family protein n=1 Tax=Salinisphaera sp. Q1T1-3 TaxID=2321229 RepID=UPI000E76466A|nr:carbon-nitrogen hydrolase family protein [Salinisphaera sp. Q1T1-3]RJS95063.1 GNAT family N-acetyltransferase [Salinisphaera sp. Q1T1-3]
MPPQNSRSRLIVRTARLSDIPAINRIVQRTYPRMDDYSFDELRGQINNFPDGQLVAVYEDEVVGYCATICLPENQVMRRHSWAQISGNGYGSTHDIDGDYLYGYEICVDPDARGLRIGRRLYREREALAVKLGLKGIVFVGRIPGLRRRYKQYGSAEAYVQAVADKTIRDRVLSFQLSQGYELIGVMPGYLPDDRDSMGYGAHLIWRNPEYKYREDVAGDSHVHLQRRNTVRIATVQYMQRAVDSFDEFAQIVTYFVRETADAKSDFVVFPELFTVQLLSIKNEDLRHRAAIQRLADFTDDFRELMADLAVRYNINIIAGSHVTWVGDELQNIAYIYLRDGSEHQQPKIHPTPGERHYWNIVGGSSLNAIETDCGPVGVLVCYDSEFPELSRHLADQGINILFVPFSTEDRAGYLRVRYSAHARAVENQIYVATSGNTGNLPRIHAMDMHYAQSGIFTPCDFAFARDGIAADTTPNAEQVAIADVRLDTLHEARTSGSVQNMLDRRHDLYRVQWKPRRRAQDNTNRPVNAAKPGSARSTVKS